MDKVSVFESSDFGELRIIVDPKGDVWFVASDVAKSLGYINAKDAVKRHVDDDDSMLLQVSDNQWGVKRSILKTRYIDSIRIINESGLYSLILSSKLESAKRFKKWVTSEVLPSIRKTGEYKTSSGGKGILVPDFSNPADAARAWADQYEAAQKAIAEKSQAEAEKQQALKTIEEHKPDVEFAESFRKVDHNNMWLIRDIAKKLEQNGVIIAEKNLRSFLEEAKFMFRNGLGKWELYSNVVVKGYGVYRSYYDHYGMHEKMKEMEERENELEERERRLEERERRHEMEDREYRRMGYESYPTDYYGDDRYYGDGPQMRRGRGRGRGRSY